MTRTPSREELRLGGGFGLAPGWLAMTIRTLSLEPVLGFM